MSLDVELIVVQPVTIYSANITHNLGKMAAAVGVYQYLWRPEEIQVSYAEQLILPLRKAIKKLKSAPARYKKYEATNGWGDYAGFLQFLENYLAACEQFPESTIAVHR